MFPQFPRKSECFSVCSDRILRHTNSKVTNWMLRYFLLLQTVFYKFEMIVCWRCGGRKIQLLNELFHGLSRFEQICFRLNARKHTNVFCLQWMIFTEFEAKYFEYFYEKLCSYKWVCGCIIIAARLNLSIKFATFLCKTLKLYFLLTT